MANLQEKTVIESCYRQDGVSIFYDGTKTDVDTRLDHKRKVPKLVRGTLADLKLSKDYLWKPRHYYPGLEKFVRIDREGGAATYVVDMHQHAFFGWMESVATGLIKPGKTTLLRFDMHDDMWNTPEEAGDDLEMERIKLEKFNLDKIREYIGHNLNEGNFVSRGMALGLFNRVINIEPARGMAEDFHVVEDIGMERFDIDQVTPDFIKSLSKNGGLVTDFDWDFFNLHATPTYDEEYQNSMIKKRKKPLPILLAEDQTKIRLAINSSRLATVSTTPSVLHNKSQRDFYWQVLKSILK